MRATLQKNFNTLTDILSFSDSYTPEDVYKFTGGRTTYPGSTWYFSPLNAVNLFELPDYKVFDKIPFVLIRDGLYAITFFFHLYPEPGKIKTILILHETLANFVPEAWMSQVLFYNHQINIKDVPYNTRKKELIITASLDQSSFTNEYYVNKLQEAKSFIDQEGINKIRLMLFCRKNSYITPFEDISRYIANRTKDALDILDNDKIQFITWKKIRKSNDLINSYSLDLNLQGRFHVDSFLNHHMFSHHCLPIQTVKKTNNKETTLFVRQSHYHGMALTSETLPNYKNKFPLIEEMMSYVKLPEIPSKTPFRGVETLFPKEFLFFLDDISKEERAQSAFYRTDNFHDHLSNCII
jgi:hypothetical protein